MRGALAAALVVTLLAAGCTSDDDEPDDSPTPAPSGSPTSAAGTAESRAAARGVSDPVEDSIYSAVGDPGVDALSYALDLEWTAATRTLHGVETVRVRATDDADQLQLDLGDPLEVLSVKVDGRLVNYSHDGKDLVVRHEVEQDRRYTLVIDYTGTPQPVPAPTLRRDIASIGWTTMPDGEVWTMQEPFGAYTWYAVNDQPSDKARYSFTIDVPAPWVGVANGELRSRRTQEGRTVTRWVLDDPASSYLVTIAIGDLVETKDRSASGVPITYWTPRDGPDLIRRLRRAPEGLAWLEERLGPYPFDTLGFVIVPSHSGMETQTMITLGDTEYATSPEVLVHEMAHQWYGDQVTPTDWRDVWMNEGMAMYLQGAWTAEEEGVSLESVIDSYAADDPTLRGIYGPPGAYLANAFGAGNVYYGPAVMWDEVRQKLGDEEFWRLARAWPASHDHGNANYPEITSWWSKESGEDLSDLFNSWVLGAETPERD